MYTSREWDEEIELYYYRARHYEPRIGRFIQRDPIGYYDDTNLYRYVGNSSMNYTDPWGLENKSLLKDSSDIMLAIFERWFVDFSQQRDLNLKEKIDFFRRNEWLWPYDLIYNTQLLSEYWEQLYWSSFDINEYVLFNSGLWSKINIWWIEYVMWEVSNTLVWFNASNIWFWNDFLVLWAAITVYDWEISKDQSGNWLLWEYGDRSLYAAWYLMAQHRVENWSIDKGIFLRLLQQWVNNRSLSVNDPWFLMANSIWMHENWLIPFLRWMKLKWFDATTIGR